MNAVADLAAALRAEATRADERRLLVLAGDRDAGYEAARRAIEAAGVEPASVAAVTDRDRPDWETVAPRRSRRLLGTTREAVVLDAHVGFSPNGLGQVVGAVDGGGLLILLAPPLGAWPDADADFDETLAVPPFGVEDVAGNFRRRLVETIRTHPGVAVVDVDADPPTVEADGLTDPEPAPERSPPSPPPTGAFPTAAYEACLTADQVRAVRGLEALRDPGSAVVVEADRGRGKSSAAGLAAGALAAEGRDVLVTAPAASAAAEVFARAEELLRAVGDLDPAASAPDRRLLVTTAGGRLRFEDPPAAADRFAGENGDAPDALVVDEAAALPVRLLTRLLAAPAVAFCTTVHGYEGAGRGFDVRFRDRLADSERAVTDVELAEPIRYAAGDPVESWAFRALLLDARPAVDPAVEEATPDSVGYRAVTPADLLADEHLLREAFGLLVLAHYRTEPNDLARLLDAPNLHLRALVHEGHVVSVALLAREGGLDADRRAAMYEGSRVRGNMLPDVLTSQLRDEAAAVPVGYRVVRIATHHAVRSTGLGSRLLSEIEREAGGDALRSPGVDDADTDDAGTDDAALEAVDWLGVGYGATPDLLRFWAGNGYRSVHLSTTRNDASGEYSAIMLRPLTDDGAALQARHAQRFRDRVAGLLADPLRDADPDVVRATLRTIDAPPNLDLSPYEWRVAVGAAYGPGLSDVAPGVFRDLALAAFLADGANADASDVDDDPLAGVDEREARLLVRKCLQASRWSAVADELGYVSTGECMRTFGATLQPIVDAFGGETARAERDRFTEEE